MKLLMTLLWKGTSASVISFERSGDNAPVIPRSPAYQMQNIY